MAQTRKSKDKARQPTGTPTKVTKVTKPSQGENPRNTAAVNEAVQKLQQNGGQIIYNQDDPGEGMSDVVMTNGNEQTQSRRNGSEVSDDRGNQPPRDPVAFVPANAGAEQDQLLPSAEEASNDPNDVLCLIYEMEHMDIAESDTEGIVEGYVRANGKWYQVKKVGPDEQHDFRMVLCLAAPEGARLLDATSVKTKGIKAKGNISTLQGVACRNPVLDVLPRPAETKARWKFPYGATRVKVKWRFNGADGQPYVSWETLADLRKWWVNAAFKNTDGQNRDERAIEENIVVKRKVLAEKGLLLPNFEWAVLSTAWARYRKHKQYKEDPSRVASPTPAFESRKSRPGGVFVEGDDSEEEL